MSDYAPFEYQFRMENIMQTLKILGWNITHRMAKIGSALEDLMSNRLYAVWIALMLRFTSTATEISNQSLTAILYLLQEANIGDAQPHKMLTSRGTRYFHTSDIDIMLMREISARLDKRSRIIFENACASDNLMISFFEDCINNPSLMINTSSRQLAWEAKIVADRSPFIKAMLGA